MRRNSQGYYNHKEGVSSHERKLLSRLFYL